MAEIKKKYYDELNIFRSLIIIWVVIGHSFNSGNDFLGLLHVYAYSFHMKAFILLSGLLFAKKLKAVNGFKDGLMLVKDRFLRLMVPYFFYTAVSIVLKIFLDEYANNKLSMSVIKNSLLGVSNPNGGLWFLYALFVISVFAVLLSWLPSWAGLLISAVLYGVYLCVPVLAVTPIVNFITCFGIYFFIGVYLYEHYDKISEAMNEFVNSRKTISTAVALIYLPAAFMITVVLARGVQARSIQYFLLALMNITVYYLLSVVINAFIKIKKPFMTVGCYGMDIYLIGYYVQITLRVLLKSMLGMPYLVYSAAMFVFGLLLPIPISKYIVRKFRILRIFALGDYKKTKPKEVENNGEEA